MNIIRIVTPEKTYRIRQFSNDDYLQLLFVRSEIEKNPEEAEQILDELLEESFPDMPKIYRPYAFIIWFTASIGKTVLPIRFKCPKCGKEKKTFLNLELKKLNRPVLETSGIKIYFDFTNNMTTNIKQLFDSCIYKIEDANSEYLWEDLDQENKNLVMSVISLDDFETIIKDIYPIYIPIKFSCCESHEMTYRNILDLFKIILSEEEIITFYKINHIMVKQGYSLSDIEKMTPMNRTITLALIEKDIKDKKHAKSGIS